MSARRPRFEGARLVRVEVASEPIHGLTARLQHVEVDLASERDRLPFVARIT